MEAFGVVGAEPIEREQDDVGAGIGVRLAKRCGRSQYEGEDEAQEDLLARRYDGVVQLGLRSHFFEAAGVELVCSGSARLKPRC
jgi:hypothetical protein